MPIIELQDVSKLYGFGDATTLALDEASLSIEEGEFVAIMGPSGCGKSTLMNIIGLLDRPTHGMYRLQGRPVETMRSGRRAKIRRDTIGFVFQFFNLLPRMTVLENVALPLAYKGVGARKRLKLAADMLERVGLTGREFYYPRHLSGGQAQCAAIARALINNPKILIADEPTGNLDSASSRLVMELLSEIHKSGSTVLFVTHNPELTRYATRVVYMHDGTVIQDKATRLGEVAPGLEDMYRIPKRTEEDDLAGVSTLMKARPDKPVVRRKPAKPARAAKKKKQAAKSRTRSAAAAGGKK